LSGDNKKLLVLWAVVIVSYGFIIFFAQPVRLLRFSPEEQAVIFGELQRAWCGTLEVENFEQMMAMRRDVIRPLGEEYGLIPIDVRLLMRRGVKGGWDVQPCAFQAATHILCGLPQEEGFPVGTVMGSFGLRPQDVALYADYGFAQGWEAHPCYYEQGLPSP
jgi:hypothetical protein